MAGVTKKVERIPPHLPQASSASSQARALSLSLLPSLSSYHSLFSPLHHRFRRPPTCSRRRLEYSGAGAASSSRYTPPGVLSPLSLSLSLSLSLFLSLPPHLLPSALPFSLPPTRPFEMGRRHSSSLSLSLLALASTKWEKPQPPPKPRLRPGHRLPPSFHSPPLPPSLSPPSLPSTYLSLSPSLLPSRVVVFTAGHRCRLRPSDGHLPPPQHPFPSSPLLPSLPSPSLFLAARRPPCPPSPLTRAAA